MRISMNIKTLAPSVAGFVSISQRPANKTMFKQQNAVLPDWGSMAFGMGIIP